MKIKIKNIGKINHAEVLLDGITVIAGENNTGKSTIGKTLFALLHEMNVWEENYYTRCSNELYDVIKTESKKLEDFCLKNTNAARRRTNRANELNRKLADDKEFIAQIEDFQISESGKINQQKEFHEACQQVRYAVEKYCKEYIALYQKNGVSEIIETNKEFINNWIQNLLERLKDEVELDEAVLQARALKNSFNQCFRGQYKTLSVDDEVSEVVYQEDGIETIFTISNTEEKISKPIITKRGVYFVESPRLFDAIGRRGIMRDPQVELRRLMVPNSFDSSAYNQLYTFRYVHMKHKDSYIDESISKEAKDILNMLVEEMNGQAEFYVKEGIKFKEKDFSDAFFSQNVSTGLKALAFLEYAIRMGAIQKNDILILDEPEINLHPEWQVTYARALVLLQKAYNLTILITSHSPYFIRAIECFSDIYNTLEQLNVYLVEKDEQNRYAMSNVMESEYGLADLYEILSAPFDSLQEEINNKYSS